MYEKNIALLEEKIKAHAFIRPIKMHLKADGSFDYEGNLKLWDTVCADFEKLYLWEDGQKNQASGVDAAYLIIVPASVDAAEKHAETILVAHGGGFGIRTGCEGANVAWEFHKRGYNTAILVYRMQPHSRYESVADMQRAVCMLREKASELGFGKKIVAMGFSAGAMLAGNCATLPLISCDSKGNVLSEGAERLDFSAVPDLAVISYGAMSAVSFPKPFMMELDETLFGANPAERHYFAPEKHVTTETPPMFIWQTLSDDGRHGMCLAKALQDAGVAYELHIMEGGVHGLALADGENDLEANIPHINHWVMLCDEWIQMHA